MLALQRAAGNTAVNSMIAQRVPDSGQMSEINATADAVVHEASAKEGAPPEERPPAGDPAAIRARQRAAFAQPDKVSAERSKVVAAAAETKTEAARPAAPVTPPRPAPAAPPESRAPQTEAPAAAVASASDAVARAAAVPVPEPPAQVAPPAFAPPVDSGGRPVPANPVADQAVAAVAIKLQQLRYTGHQLAAEAAASRARGHALEAGLQTARAKVAEADTSITTVRGHVDQRRAVADQSKNALTSSTEKATQVAAEAPGFASKADEGKAKTGPMVSEARQLGGRAASVQPEDAEAAGKAREQAGQVNRIGNDLGSIDGAISATGQRATGLVDEAARATALNSEASGKIAATEATLASTTGKLDELTAQNTQAKSDIAALAGGPAEMREGAAQLDERGAAAMTASTALESRLHATQTAYLGAMASVPARQLRQGPALQREAYGDRERVNLTHGLPAWLTGEDPPSARARAEQAAAAEQRRLDELRQIEAESHGNFASLGAGAKASLALRMTFSRLTGSLGATNWPKFGLNILRGFVDPRVSMTGVLTGLGMILSGGANLFSRQQWERDPVGNLLKSAADIATGITIVLGSVAGLAIAVIAICAAAILLTFGAASPVCVPIITFCSSVAATVGPWAVEAAAIALELNAFVLIKNLVDAATADTAGRLRQESEDMASDTETMGVMAMQIAGEKAGQVVGPRISNAVGAVQSGLQGSTSVAARAMGAAIGDIRGAVAAGRPFGSGAEPAPVAEGAAAGEGATAGEAPVAAGEAPAVPESAVPDTAPASEAPAVTEAPAVSEAPAASEAPAPAASDAPPVSERAPAPADLPEGTAANDNAIPEFEPVDVPEGTAANDNARPSGEPVEAALPATGTDGQPARRQFTVIEGEGGRAPDRPVASAGTGERLDLRQVEIIGEFVEGQGKATSGDLGEDALGQHGMHDADTPGGAGQRPELERGNFAHEHGDVLVPEDQMPRGLNREFEIEFPEGGSKRLDRVDMANGVIYEIKPNTPSAIAEGQRQVAIYVLHMNEQYPRPGGWSGRVVTYDPAAAAALLGQK
ncbi:hypothetical protein GCM10010178_56680 [Lentzea flava]|uniref:Tox-REase-9 domain-containing protein n=2 Tax=Lentzea flava TaxID=103732 RepID=A0ABQ2UXT8_9PSEU|nr:Restriction endonuclease fold toxin 9 [Lentzea flava]GGU56971.1 hypothetical protein GCM10010178_56680 [Lentzea flava]